MKTVMTMAVALAFGMIGAQAALAACGACGGAQQQSKLRDGTCVSKAAQTCTQTKAQTKTQTKTQTRARDGSCLKK